jgi:hypothetical protein
MIDVPIRAHLTYENLSYHNTLHVIVDYYMVEPNTLHIYCG